MKLTRLFNLEYLVSKGIPADKNKIRAEGKDKQIDQKTAEALLAKSNPKMAKWMVKDKKITWLAFNRRADVVLEPTGQQSAKIYPADAPDARIVWQRPEPPLKKVEMLSRIPATSVRQASAGNSGNRAGICNFPLGQCGVRRDRKPRAGVWSEGSSRKAKIRARTKGNRPGKHL